MFLKLNLSCASRCGPLLRLVFGFARSGGVAFRLPWSFLVRFELSPVCCRRPATVPRPLPGPQTASATAAQRGRKNPSRESVLLDLFGEGHSLKDQVTVESEGRRLGNGEEESGFSRAGPHLPGGCAAERAARGGSASRVLVRGREKPSERAAASFCTRLGGLGRPAAAAAGCPPCGPAGPG